MMIPILKLLLRFQNKTNLVNAPEGAKLAGLRHRTAKVQLVPASVAFPL